MSQSCSIKEQMEVYFWLLRTRPQDLQTQRLILPKGNSQSQCINVRKNTSFAFVYIWTKPEPDLSESDLMQFYFYLNGRIGVIHSLQALQNAATSPANTSTMFVSESNSKGMFSQRRYIYPRFQRDVNKGIHCPDQRLWSKVNSPPAGRKVLPGLCETLWFSSTIGVGVQLPERFY